MLLRRYSKYIKLIFFSGDILFLNLAYIASLYFRYGDFHRINLTDFQTIWLFSNFTWIVLVSFFNAYQFIRVEPIEKTLAKSLRLVVYHFLIILIIIIILNFDNISRLRLLYFYLIFFAEIFIFRIVFIQLLKRLRRKGFNFRNVIIIGAGKSGNEINKFLLRDLSYGYRVLGFFDDDLFDKKNTNTKILGSVSDVKKYLEKNPVHEIYFAISDYSSEKITEIIDFCEEKLIRIKFIPDFNKFTKKKKVSIDFYDHIPVVLFRKEPLQIPFNNILKRFFDIGFSLFMIIIVFPWLFPILIILIKITSKGPIFFIQKRTGEDNKTFHCVKFRTMKVNKHADSVQATKNDQRITKLGKFMRKSNLDELPQFFNVFVGDMSIVGPRPHMLAHTEQYSALIKNYLVRHYAKPGITGWAQVNGFRGETKELEQMQNRVEHDIWYIENWSFLLDMKIIFKTTANMFKGEENAG